MNVDLLLMYQGKTWKILLPTKRIDAYTAGDLKLVRGTDNQYNADFKERLEKAKSEAAELAKKEQRDLRDGKLAGLRYTRETETGAEVGLMQMGYVAFEAMNLMARKGENIPNEYRENIGVMSTVRTADNKSLHSTRSPATATWGGYDSLFGRGLTGEDGDVDKLVEKGTGHLFSVIARQVALELGIEENEIDKLYLKGIAEGFTYRDHTFAFHAALKTESEKIVGKDGVQTKPKTPGKYQKIFRIDASGEEMAKYLAENRIIDVAIAQIVLTGSGIFGEEWVNRLVENGIVDK